MVLPKVTLPESAPNQLFTESIVALGPATFRPMSLVAQLSALGDGFSSGLLTRWNQAEPELKSARTYRVGR
jgi:hypothetical protein